MVKKQQLGETPSAGNPCPPPSSGTWGLGLPWPLAIGHWVLGHSPHPSRPPPPAQNPQPLRCRVLDQSRPYLQCTPAHPTRNPAHTGRLSPFDVGCWMLDVRCFPVPGTVALPDATAPSLAPSNSPSRAAICRHMPPCAALHSHPKRRRVSYQIRSRPQPSRRGVSHQSRPNLRALPSSIFYPLSSGAWSFLGHWIFGAFADRGTDCFTL